MTTVRIARVVKYKGVVYPANVDIPVDKEDVADLLSRGGWVINKEAPAKQPGSEEDDAKGAAVGDTGTENTGSSAADGDNAESGTDSNKDDDASASANANDEKAAGKTSDEDNNADEIDELREYAEALGIEVRKNWGIAKLKKEIAAAESN